MNADKLKSLQIDPGQKQRPTGIIWTIVIVVLVVTLGAIYMARPKAGTETRMVKSGAKTTTTSTTAAAARPIRRQQSPRPRHQRRKIPC